MRTQWILGVAVLSMAVVINGCDKGSSPKTTAKADDHGHEHNADGSHKDDHAHDARDAGHTHGADAVALGEVTSGKFTITASRDKGDVIAGKDMAFDVVITAKDGAKIAAVRFWIGTEDGKGSVKAKAEIEDPKDPTRWHTHAEVPSPLPAASKFWCEVEDDKGGKVLSSFDLKM